MSPAADAMPLLTGPATAGKRIQQQTGSRIEFRAGLAGMRLEAKPHLRLCP